MLETPPSRLPNGERDRSSPWAVLLLVASVAFAVFAVVLLAEGML